MFLTYARQQPINVDHLVTYKEGILSSIEFHTITGVFSWYFRDDRERDKAISYIENELLGA